MLTYLIALCTSPFALQDGAADWPQFLGPERTGETASSGASFAWSEGEPEVLWRRPVGPGYGGVAVRDGEVFLLDRELGEADALRVLDLASGEELWRATYPALGRLQYPGSRTVPTVTEELVITCGGHGRVTGYDRRMREEAWSVDLQEDYGGQIPRWGWACSPLLVDGLVVVVAFGREVGLVAFDATTGEEVWVTEPVGLSHSTPVLLELRGQPQVVFLSVPPSRIGGDGAGPCTITGYDPMDGSVLWTADSPLGRHSIPGPVQVDDERFFVTGGYRGGSSMFRLVESGTGFELERLFHIERGSQIHTPILHGEHLYFIANENWNDPRARRPEGGLLCLDLEGNELWRTGEAPYFGRGNAILAGGHLIIQDGYDGKLRVVRATPEGYQQVAEADVFGIEDNRDHQMWAPIALASGKLLMRSQEELVCLRL